MGEYIQYYQIRIAGRICNEQLLVKPVAAALQYTETYHPAAFELPYPGAKEMLKVEDMDNRTFLIGLFEAILEELPFPEPRKKKKPASS